MPRMLRLHRFEGPAGLQIDEVAKAEPGPGEVRIAIEAFALNYGDLYLMDDEYVFDVELPTAICDESVGIVDAIGAGVTRHKVGDRVSTLPFMNDGYQVSGETALVPEEFAVACPESLSNAEVCALWVQYLTAYYPLVELSQHAENDWVLVTAGASTAGGAALEICRREGINVIATTRSESQFDYIKQLGATEVIVPGDDFAERIMAITEGRGVKTVYDSVGDPLMSQYSHVLAQHAQIFLYGGLDSTPDMVPVIPMIKVAAILRPYSVYHHIYDAEQRQRGVSYVFDGIAKGELKPQVDKVFALEDFPAAYEYQVNASGRRGKIVLTTV